MRGNANTGNAKGRAERGNALVEFALVWSVLWALFAGVYQFGYSMYVYNSLMIAASNAAQLGSKLTYDLANPGAFTTAIANMTVYGDTAAGSAPIVPGLNTANVSVSVSGGATADGSHGDDRQLPAGRNIHDVHV